MCSGLQQNGLRDLRGEKSSCAALGAGSELIVLGLKQDVERDE